MDGKTKRTKYSLDGNVPKSFPNFLRPFDALCDPEGARIVNTATGEATVAGVVGPSPSTLFSAIGSLFIWVIFIGWALMIIDAYQRDPPIIYEKTLDTPRDFEAPMPDFAMTLSLEPRDFYVASQIRQIKAARGSSRTWKEAEWEAKDEWKLLSEDQQNFYKAVDDRTLEYLWPVFRWEKIMTADGLEVMDQDKSLLGPEDGLSFGDECGLWSCPKALHRLSTRASPPSSWSGSRSSRSGSRSSRTGGQKVTNRSAFMPRPFEIISDHSQSPVLLNNKLEIAPALDKAPSIGTGVVTRR